MTEPLLSLRNVDKQFGAGVKALDDVSLDVFPGEIVGLVGESGSGKTTLGRIVARLLASSGGQILFEGRDIAPMTRRELFPVRRKIQMVFQDPYSSLNPMVRVGNFVREPLRVHRICPNAAAERDRVAELFEMVGLPASAMTRYPHEFSGGQRQRIGIARALALKPSLLVADEPITALDVSIQAQIINLLDELNRKLDLTILFIAHDLMVVRHLCDRVAVMYRGQLVEVGPSVSVFDEPRHPYTQALQSAIPLPDPRIERLRVRRQFEGPVPASRESHLAEVGPSHFVRVRRHSGSGPSAATA